MRLPQNQCILFVVLLLLQQSCGAFSDPWDATSLIEIKQGPELSSKMGLYQGGGGYELSAGSPVSLKGWYTPTFVDARVTYMTQAHQKVGLIWALALARMLKNIPLTPV